MSKARFLALLALLACTTGPAFAVQFCRLPPTPNGPDNMSSVQRRAFSWEGSCSIRCADGQCRFVCGSGLVYSNSVIEARLEAEAALRLQAQGAGGAVIEGSISVTIRSR